MVTQDRDPRSSNTQNRLQTASWRDIYFTHYPLQDSRRIIHHPLVKDIPVGRKASMLMRLKAPSVNILLLAVVAFCFESSGYAQLSTASVTGIVRDVTGAVIPQAKVVLRNVGTSVERNTTSNNAGNYLFLNVNPGSYTLETSVAGFKSAHIAEFTLAVNQTATLDL